MSKENNEGSKPKVNLLSTIDPKELKSIKVALKRNDVASNSQVRPLIRTLDDPALLRVNLSGVEGRLIFYRGDVRPNCHDVTNEQFYSEHERGSSDPPQPENSDSQPGPSRTSFHKSLSDSECELVAIPDVNTNYRQRSRTLFGEYINSPPPFEVPPEEGSCCRHKQKDYHSKPIQRSRSRDRYSKSPSSRNSKERHEDDYRSSRKLRRSRSISEEHRNKGKNKNYRKPSYYRERSPPLRHGEYRPKRRKSKSRSSSKSPEPGMRHYFAKNYKSKENSPTQDGTHRSYKGRSRSNSPRRSPYRNKYMESKTRRYSKSPDTRRRHSSRELSPRYRGKRPRTPTRLGEYRPRSFSRERHVTHSPPLKSSENRHRRRSPNSPPLRPGEYRGPKHRNYYPAPPQTEYLYYGDLQQGGLVPQFGHPSVPSIRPVYIPVPIFPMRPPFHPPMNRPPRPNIVYNNRPIPKLTPLPHKEEPSNASNCEPDESATDDKKGNDANESK